ncbi:NADH-quinone oxidoreductase subunit J [Candidatus Bathyarchaeota archaeon]|nr:NADH-quinone oxidoreductase subunit J [Candidatus Bathyarchaeota archaeon]
MILAVLTVELEDILYSILSFCGMCIVLGVIFWILNAPYVAVFQMLVYAGAIVAMFIAAVMLTTRKERLG